MQKNPTDKEDMPQTRIADSDAFTYQNGDNNTVCRPLIINIVFLADPPPDIGAVVREAIDAATQIRRLKRIRKSVYASVRKDNTQHRRRKQ